MVSAEVAKRYAAGLFALAAERKLLDQVAGELGALGQVFRSDRALLDFLDAPQITDQDKARVMEKIFKGRVSEAVRTFLELVIRKRRSRYIVEIAEHFEQLVLERKGFLKVRVVSAVPLTKGELDSLTAKLAKKTGKQILATQVIDRRILGGLVVYLGHQVIDKSVRYQLLLLRDRLREVKVH